MVLSAFAIIFMTEPYADVDSNAICTYGRGRTKALSILKKLNAAGLRCYFPEAFCSKPLTTASWAIEQDFPALFRIYEG